MLIPVCCRKSTVEALTLACYHGDGLINQEADQRNGLTEHLYPLNRCASLRVFLSGNLKMHLFELNPFTFNSFR